MNAAVIVEPGTVQVRPIPKPEPGPFEALVKIEACGLCGTTDRHLVAGTQCYHQPDHYPAVLGHEAVGTIVALGDNVSHFKLGDRVTRATSIWPGEKRGELFSAWGGFAEYGIVRDRLAMAEAGDEAYRDNYLAVRQVVAPAGIDPVDASLAISVSELASWVWQLGAIGGRSIAVGGTGLAGCAICAVASLAGAGPIIAIGRRDDRLAHARRLGAHVTINSGEQDVAAEVRKATDGKGAEFFAEATGVDDVFAKGLSALVDGGVAAIYGAPDDQRYTLAMANAPGNFTVRRICPQEHLAYAWACHAIQNHTIDPALLCTHVFDGLEHINELLQLQEQGQVVMGFIRM